MVLTFENERSAAPITHRLSLTTHRVSATTASRSFCDLTQEQPKLRSPADSQNYIGSRYQHAPSSHLLTSTFINPVVCIGMKADPLLTSFLRWSAEQGIQVPSFVELSSRDLIVKQANIISPTANDVPTFCANTPISLTQTSSYRCMTLNKAGLTSGNDGNGNGKLSIKTDGTISLVNVPLTACIIEDDSLALAERLAYEYTDNPQQSSVNRQPWFDLLPTNFEHTMPRFWNPERVETISRFDGRQLQRHLELEESRYKLFPGNPWALACVDSRSNFLPDGRYAMTPMLDMFNHDGTVQTRAGVHEREDSSGSANADDDKVLDLRVAYDSLPTSTQETSMFGSMFQSLFGNGKDDDDGSNDEIKISYGPLPNLETLCNYGFVANNGGYNPYNFETFPVRLAGGRLPITLVVGGDGDLDGSNACKIDTLQNDSSLRMLLSRMGDEEEEMYALITGELDAAIDNAAEGVRVMSGLGGDDPSPTDPLAQQYLQGRLATLERAQETLKRRFPQLYD